MGHLRRFHDAATCLAAAGGRRAAAPVTGGAAAGRHRRACHGDDLPAHHASADLFLFPSLTETFGNVTTEAMASGLSVVAVGHAVAMARSKPAISSCSGKPSATSA